jgi:thioredoxin-related protein
MRLLRTCSSWLAGTLALLVLVSALAPSSGAGERSEAGTRLRILDASALPEALETARTQGKPVALLFKAGWCPACRRFFSTTLTDTALLPLLRRFVWVAIDIDRRLSLAREYGVAAVPTLVLLTPDGEGRRIIPGSQDSRALRRSLVSFLEGRGESAGSHRGAVVEAPGPASALVWMPVGYRAQAICFAHVGYGPLHLRTQSPFQALRSSTLPTTPSTLGRAEWQLSLRGTWANVWAKDTAHFDPQHQGYGGYFLDYETLSSSVDIAYGLADTLQLEVEYEEQSRFGGQMDGMIQGFHERMGIDQGGRTDVPRNGFSFFIDPRDGRPAVDLNAADRGSSARNLLLRLQHTVTCGAADVPAFSWSLGVRWSVGLNHDFQRAPASLCGSLALARRFGRFYTYVTLSEALYRRNAFHGLELRRSQLSVRLAGEWRRWSRVSLLFQYLASQGVLPGIRPFADFSHETTLGLKAELPGARILELGLVENVIIADNSPDFGIHLGLSQRF